MADTAKKGFQPIAAGIVGMVEGDMLTLKITLDRNGKASVTGKSIVLASTRGNVAVEDFKIGINVYKPTV